MGNSKEIEERKLRIREIQNEIKLKQQEIDRERLEMEREKNVFLKPFLEELKPLLIKRLEQDLVTLK